ncbi:hypothetical protein J4229_00140 [Candidatus Pacearchaeota archaeon]|nr:hypothetical protein [Candidatus Pacearchaeota archaeon]
MVSKNTGKAGEKVEKISEKEIERELDEIESENNGSDNDLRDVKIKSSKEISKLGKGDKVKIDDIEYEVDSHYVLIDHGTTKEMAIEVFDKNEGDYQIRYFNDQVERTIDFYELQGEIMFVKKPFKKIEW